jgi:predicted DNA-binding transcriptional regulator AlpA
LALEVRALQRRISPATPLNPSFDECGCAWGRKEWERGLEHETDHGGIFSFGNMSNGERLHETLPNLLLGHWPALLGCSRQWVNQMAREDPTFPAPEAELAGGRVWSREAIEKWAKATGREIKS